MIWNILAFGTFWFWLLIAITSVLIIVSTEDKEDNYPASIWLIVSCLLLYFFGNSETFKYIGKLILLNPGKIIGMFLGYIFIGILWSIFKWFFYLHKIKREFLEKSATYSWHPNFNIEDYRVNLHKERIFHWMMYWPFSGIWTLINDPFKHAFQWLITHCGSIFNKIAESVFNDINNKKS